MKFSMRIMTGRRGPTNYMIDGQIGEAELETAGLAVIPRRYHQKGFVFSTGV